MSAELICDYWMYLFLERLGPIDDIKIIILAYLQVWRTLQVINEQDAMRWNEIISLHLDTVNDIDIFHFDAPESNIFAPYNGYSKVLWRCFKPMVMMIDKQNKANKNMVDKDMVCIMNTTFDENQIIKELNGVKEMFDIIKEIDGSILYVFIEIIRHGWWNYNNHIKRGWKKLAIDKYKRKNIATLLELDNIIELRQGKSGKSYWYLGIKCYGKLTWSKLKLERYCHCIVQLSTSNHSAC